MVMFGEYRQMLYLAALFDVWRPKGSEDTAVKQQYHRAEEAEQTFDIPTSEPDPSALYTVTLLTTESNQQLGWYSYFVGVRRWRQILQVFFLLGCMIECQ